MSSIRAIRTLFLPCLFLLISSSTATAERWYEYLDCKLIKKEYFDGDSFHVKTKSNHYIFRLYFVDTAETSCLVPERVTEQAEYWNIDEQQVLALGKKAKRFTLNFLKNGFTVYSKREDAMGRSRRDRFFGMIKVKDKYLSEALVEAGLARVYGAWTDLPDGTKYRKFNAQLKILERKARREKKGLWEKNSLKGISSSGSPVPESVSLTLTCDLAVYSADKSRRYLGKLRKGSNIIALNAETPTMIRIRFIDKKNTTNEFLCYKNALSVNKPEQRPANRKKTNAN